MCQATVYLNGEEIMKDVLLVEPVPEGIRLATLFEPPRIVPAVIRKIDLIKHRVILESLEEVEGAHERTRETTGSDSPLD
jgi:predicted RNA-binding protein